MARKRPAHRPGPAGRLDESGVFQRFFPPFQLAALCLTIFHHLIAQGSSRMSFSRKFPFARRALPVLLAALLTPSLASAFTPFVVRDIQVNGIQRVDAGTIFSYLPVKVGDQFTEAQASEAIQRLYATGFFSDVKIDTSNNVLVVTVQERPTIASVSFNGMREFDSKAITKSLAQVGFGQGRVFDRSMLERAEFELKQQYLSK